MKEIMETLPKLLGSYLFVIIAVTAGGGYFLLFVAAVQHKVRRK